MYTINHFTFFSLHVLLQNRFFLCFKCIFLSQLIFPFLNKVIFGGKVTSMCCYKSSRDAPFKCSASVPLVRNSSASTGDIASEDTEDLRGAVQDAEICLLKSGELT